MSEDRFAIDGAIVHRLIVAQFPQWADLPIRRVEPGGWDNVTFHLGDRMSVRMPSAERYLLQVEKEHRWLPRLAPHLPLPIPVPLAQGRPTTEYPWPWSIYRWIEGECAAVAPIADPIDFATSLAQFLVALQRIDATGGPAPGPHNFYRGGPLTVYDAETREALRTLKGRIDIEAATAVWEAALQARWSAPPVWVHGDVSAGNLLVRAGRLSAVIDFGSSGVGDPACDLVFAWTFLKGAARQAFTAALPLDSGTWARGRGWALWKALIMLAPTIDCHPDEAEIHRQVLREVLDDHARNA